MKKSLFATAFIFIALTASAQYGYRDSNMIGISFGVNQFTLNTNNFETKPGTDICGGLSVRGNFYNDFDMVFGLQFSENTFSVKTINAALLPEDVKYTLPSAQISLLLSYKFIENYLSMEIGPMLQVNGKLGLHTEDEDNTIAGTTLAAKDIKDISSFNFYPTIGITAGVRNFRANVMYQYGVNNILGKLNKQDLGGGFEGHAGILTGSLIVYF